MTRRHQDFVRDVEPLHRSHKDYTQAFLAQRNNARRPPGWSPRPPLQPVREEGHETELHQLSFDAENQRFASFAGEKAPVSVWSGTTVARTLFDDDDNYDGDDNCDAGNRKRRKEIPSKAALRQRYLACPYSKHDICRYSPANFTEKRYRGCSKCLFPNISRLKQHLYRVHQRPENHCIRCFEVFNSSQLLDQHAQQSVSCSTKTCPFSERFTSGQMTELKRKWTGRSAEECWYTIFRILFPQGQAPTSPYVDDPATLDAPHLALEAPQMLRKIVLERLSQHQHSPATAQLLSDEVQTLLGRTIEDSLTELFQRLTPFTASNRQSIASVSDRHAADDDPFEAEDQFQGHDHGFQDEIASAKTSTKPFPSPSSSPHDRGYHANSIFDDVVDFEIWEHGLINCPLTEVDDGQHAQLNEPSANSLSLPFQQPSNFIDNTSPRFRALSEAQRGYGRQYHGRLQHARSGTMSTDYIPSSEFNFQAPPANFITATEPSHLACASCFDQQVPEKKFEPSIRSLDSGYGSVRSLSQSRSSCDLVHREDALSGARIA